MKLLIDQDLLLYKGLFATKDQGFYAGIRATDNIVESILDRFNYPEFELVMTGSGNFRKAISSDYKAHRKDSARPQYLHEAKEYYQKYWNAVLTSGIEADDYIGMNCDGNIVVSEDHDYKQLGVPIFNPRTWTITEYDNPHYWFWLQTLTGCKSDNVPGLPNPDKAHFKNQPNFTEDTGSKVLEGLSPEEMKEKVKSLYKQVYNEGWYQIFDRNCRLLFLQRKDAKEYFELY